MRIALVIAGPYPELRGSQVLVSHLARGLRCRGHTVQLVTYGPRLAGRPGLHPARAVLDLLLLVRLLRVVRRERIEVIHAHNYEAAIAGLVVARLTGLPLVYHGHSALAEELPTYGRGTLARRMLRMVGRVLDAEVPRRADFCIAVTEDLGERLQHAGVGTGLACIPPAGAPDDHEWGESSSAAGALVCYAGNLDGYQNLAFLTRAFQEVRRRLPAARLVLVTHERVRARALGAPADGVDVVEARSYGEVRRLLAAAQVAVCPRTEGSGFPMKLLNYMAAGKAIVASRSSAKGLEDGVTARLVPDGDVAAFAQAIVELLSDPAERARLGQAARGAVNGDEAWESVLSRIESIYEHVVVRSTGVCAPVPCPE